jgi:hypothetical protein
LIFLRTSDFIFQDRRFQPLTHSSWNMPRRISDFLRARRFEDSRFLSKQNLQSPPGPWNARAEKRDVPHSYPSCPLSWLPGSLLQIYYNALSHPARILNTGLGAPKFVLGSDITAADRPNLRSSRSDICEGVRGFVLRLPGRFESCVLTRGKREGRIARPGLSTTSVMARPLR